MYKNNNKRHGHNNNRRTWNDKNRNDNNNNSSAAVAKAPVQPVRQQIVPRETHEEFLKKEKAIKEYKNKQIICPLCNEVIDDMSSSMADKNTGEPIHFDCALEEASKNEKLKDNERFTYIGQGRFAVLSFEDPRDMRHFKIERIVEWEDKNKPSEWRGEIAGLYSQT